MGKNFEILLASLYGANVVINLVVGHWVSAMGWGCALLAQVRIITLLKED